MNYENIDDAPNYLNLKNFTRIKIDQLFADNEDFNNVFKMQRMQVFYIEKYELAFSIRPKDRNLDEYNFNIFDLKDKFETVFITGKFHMHKSFGSPKFITNAVLSLKEIFEKFSNKSLQDMIYMHYINQVFAFTEEV